MKYTTEELLSMTEEDILANCNGMCVTGPCLFKKKLRECREDGFCVARSYQLIDRWIEEDKAEINSLETEIDIIKSRIKKYKKWKNKIEKDIKDEQNRKK